MDQSRRLAASQQSTDVISAGDGPQPIPWGHPEGWPLIPNGHDGYLRNDHSLLPDASTDTAAVLAWFASLRGKSDNTLVAYRKEVTRFLLWLGSQGIALSAVSPDDVARYERFLADPQPASRWVCGSRKFGLGDPRWRPFAGPLSPSSRRAAITVLRNMFNWLTNSAQHLRGNPFLLTGTEAPSPTPRHSTAGARRALSAKQWAAIRTAINRGRLNDPSPTDLLRTERAKLVFLLLYGVGVRISELRSNYSGVYPITASGRRIWIWEVVGKGGKTHQHPLTEEIIEQMTIVRGLVGAPPYPAADDEYAIVPRLRGSACVPMTRAALHDLVKAIIYEAADLLDADEQDHEAQGLRQVSAHWLRHTAATESLNAGADLRATAELLGHSDIRTTQGYTHKNAEQVLAVITERGRLWENP